MTIIRYIVRAILAASILAPIGGSHQVVFGQAGVKISIQPADKALGGANDKERLLHALANLEKSPSLTFRASYSALQPEDKAKAGAGPKSDRDKKEPSGEDKPIITLSTDRGLSMSAGGKPVSARRSFAGELEIWRSPDGDMAMVSAQSLRDLAGLPRLAVYDNQDRRIVRTHYEANAFDVDAELFEELPRLLFHLSKLKKYAADASDLKPVIQGGDTMYMVSMNKRLLAGLGEGDNFSMALQGRYPVSRIEARIVCDAEGKVKALEFHVVHMSSAAGLSQVFQIYGKRVSGLNKKLDNAGLNKKLDNDKEEGKTMIYKIAVAGVEPSKTLREFAEAMRKELRK